MPDSIVVIGSLNMDFVLAVDRLPLPGETILGRDFRTIPGGKGANQAYAAAKLAGADTTVRMLGRVGADSFGAALKKNLAAQRPARSLARLQAQIDRFIIYYNEQCPHRALQRNTPAEAYAARVKAEPQGNGHPPARHYRVRHDRVDAGATISLRYRSRLRHIAVGRANKGRRVVLLIADRDVRALSTEGDLLRQLGLDPPSGNYQPLS